MLDQMPPSRNSQNQRRGFNHLERSLLMCCSMIQLSAILISTSASAVGRNLCGQGWGICCSGSGFFWPQSRRAIVAAVHSLAVLCGTTPCPQDSRSALAPSTGGYVRVAPFPWPRFS